MAEEEICYAEVVIKSKTQPRSEVKNENETVYDEAKVNKEPGQAKTLENAEAEKQNESVQDISYTTGKNEKENVYDEVKGNKEPSQTPTVDDAEGEKQNESVQQIPDTTGLLPDKTAERFRLNQQLAACFGILFVISVLTVIGVCVYLVTVNERAASELKQLRSSQKLLLEENYNLTNLTNKLSLDYKNLTIQFDNLTMAPTALENKITTLTDENHNLTFFNEELKEERKNLTETIKNMEETWNDLNVSRAQWSIDQYCRKNSGVRSCSSCQAGWRHQFSSCYAYNNAPPRNQKTWEGARENCIEMRSDLTVVSNQAEKDYVNTQSPAESDIKGFWIGLRAVGGKWKWIDGSDLTDQRWIQNQPAAEGKCVTSLNGQGWSSVSCNNSNAWICEKQALSV